MRQSRKRAENLTSKVISMLRKLREADYMMKNIKPPRDEEITVDEDDFPPNAPPSPQVAQQRPQQEPVALASWGAPSDQ